MSFKSEFGGESKETNRESYRVVKKDLLFIVNFRQSKYQSTQDKSVLSERTWNDFRKLGTALQKMFPGCFVPIIPKQ